VTTKKKPAPKPDDYVSYGYSSALAAAVPEIAALLKKAVAGKWDVQRFTDGLQNTGWWKEHSDSAKQALALQKQNPAEYAQQYKAATAHVTQIAAQMGVTLSAAQIANQATIDMWQGLNDSTLQANIGGMYTGTPAAGTGAGGSAVQLNAQINQLASQYGVPVTQGWVNTMIKQALSTGTGIEGATAALSSMAQSTYPGLAQQIAAGQTVQQIAQPYMASMAQTLEIPDGSLTLKDPTIQKALQATQMQQPKSSTGSTPPAGATPLPTLGSATGAAKANTDSAATSATPAISPGMMPLYQFQDMLRQDPRWQNTDNAKQSAFGMLHQIGADLGFAT
jgi:hypothetical protein